jgi:hypothetical protein
MEDGHAHTLTDAHTHVRAHAHCLVVTHARTYVHAYTHIHTIDQALFLHYCVGGFKGLGVAYVGRLCRHDDTDDAGDDDGEDDANNWRERES